MKRLAKLAVAGALLGGVAYIALPAGAAEPAAATAKEKNESKTVTGTVTDATGKALAGAVVFLKNTKTLAVKSYIAQDDGSFRFHALSPNVDYEVYAEKDGKRSGTKTVSQFDSRTEIRMDLKVQ
jgi:hypothetical protein